MAEVYDYRKESDNVFNDFIRIIQIIIIIVLIILLIVLSYLLYYNLPGSEQMPHISLLEKPVYENMTLSEVKQFYPNMKFNHNNISYKIELQCNNEQINKIKNAFSYINSNVPMLSFYEAEDNVDIDIICSDEQRQLKENDYFIAGEGGAKEFVQTGRYNVISSGVVYLYDKPRGTVKCSWPNVEIHEIMHVFGFNHSTSQKSLMAPYLESCDQQLDNSIIEEINYLYSEANMADLYYDNISAIKKGRYLDFNFTIKNSGDIDAENVSVSIFDEGKLVETKRIGDGIIRYGGGMFMDIKNFRLINRDSKEIMFIIDNYNDIPEYDEQNNRITINFQ